ncbi:MAG: YggT family protein [Leptolyngbyaceae bacterium]|nr:YggT family protein [Leptolyngbyaceae bacterium]
MTEQEAVSLKLGFQQRLRGNCPVLELMGGRSMYPDPHELDDLERQQELQHQQELLRLQQEGQRLETARRNTALVWIQNSVYLLVGWLEILLGLRFLLRVFGANPDNAFAQFIYNLSAPFIAPFSTLFISPVFGGGANIFDVNVLVAMLIYALLGWLAIYLIRFIEGY